jgi:hypothetical protein
MILILYRNSIQANSNSVYRFALDIHPKHYDYQKWQSNKTKRDLLTSLEMRAYNGTMIRVICLVVLLVGCSKNSVPDSAELTVSQRSEAAKTTAQTNSNCTAIFPFYWEVGDRNATLAAGVTGNGSIQGTTDLSIASATKWMFGAYVLQKKSGNLSASDIKFLNMSAGYTSFGNLTCVPSSITTVQQCASVSSNSTYTAAHDGKFFYNGGHFQKWGVDNGLGTFNESQVAAEFQSQFGSGFAFTFTSPQLAGGVNTNAVEYGKFLRKILAGQLIMKDALGTHSVCTSTLACATAVSSPMDEDFHYSLGHWVEDDPLTGDGAFSSAGLFGFYPWIDSSKTYYGIISRYEVPAGGNEIGSGYASLLCGRLIRKAFLTGTAQ